MNKTVEQKIYNIEQLVETISINMASGFEKVNDRLDGMDKRLDGMDKRLDGMDKRLDGMDNRFASLEIKIEQEISEVRVEIKDMNEGMNNGFRDTEENINGIVSDYHPRIIALEKAVFGESTLEE